MFLGVDIGGTKIAVCLGTADGTVLKKKKFSTAGPKETVDAIIAAGKELLQGRTVKAVGISCGSPQDSKRGIIQEPPNLPGWVDIPIVELMEKAFNAPAFLANDANACALAEWKYGAGQGAENMIFLTFGTGMGAGLILNGKLFEGTCGMAGEVGHIRLTPNGPEGYGKTGSFEGYCSGGGIVRLGKTMGFDYPTTKDICEAARAGDGNAQKIIEESATRLGQGLSILIDLFNPQKIVIGSIFQRAEDLFRPKMEEILKQECLSSNLAVCSVVPALLGESIGDKAALSVGVIGWEDKNNVR